MKFSQQEIKDMHESMNTQEGIVLADWIKLVPRLVRFALEVAKAFTDDETDKKIDEIIAAINKFLDEKKAAKDLQDSE